MTNFVEDKYLLGINVQCLYFHFSAVVQYNADRNEQTS